MSRPRRFRVPEIVQTSAMDCGPAALTALLTGHRLPVAYERLREACGTDLDGTSIDTLETVACELGLEAEQVMVPADHLLEPAARCLPAIVVVRQPGGATHFVVLWRRHGPWLQVMDPAVGRRVVHRDAFLRDVFRHAQPVPADAWRAWAGGDEGRSTLRARLRALGIRRAAVEGWLATAAADPSWCGFATLDAVARAAAELVRAGAVPRGRLAAGLVATLFDTADPTALRPHLAVVPAPGEPAERPGLLLLRGAVLVRVRGTRPSPERSRRRDDGSWAARTKPTAGALRILWRTALGDGRRPVVAIAFGIFLAALVVTFEALVFRGLLELDRLLVAAEQRAAAAALLSLLLLLTLGLEVAIDGGVLRAGRRLEIRLRARTLERLAKLGDDYLRSRLASDMAERCHQTHRLREIAPTAANWLRLSFQTLLTGVALVWLDPRLLAPTAATVLLAFALPGLVHPWLAERDLRMRTHAGTLSRFHLDALLGAAAVRHHGAERALIREHEALLTDWNRAACRRESAKLTVDILQAGLGYGLAVVLVTTHAAHAGAAAQVLLVAYWALALQAYGQQLIMVADQLPAYRNIARRLLEPLAAPNAPGARPATRATRDACPLGPAGIAWRNVTALVGGRAVLRDVDATVEPGEHVAVVGSSGAGKSTLVGMLLGWHTPARGTVSIDGREAAAADIAVLREATAWVDPTVALWNRSALDNVRYGARDHEPSSDGRAIRDAELLDVLERLPEGLATALGEGGCRLSGGEGQRVRLARALRRERPRLVILDEPFRGLDPAQRRRLTHRVRRRWADTTLLLVSHDVETTRAFDRVLVVEDGRIVENDAPGALASMPGSRYASLLEAERRVADRFRDRVTWRHLRLEAGRLGEAARRS